ncbi:MAG: hypothetical protein EXS09_02420 [Gemmataceae bacterium]|nr:hypothetical protein [Gemmataceae bacterium]
MTSTGRLLSGAVKYGDKNGLGPALKGVLADYAKLPEDERRAKSVDSVVSPVPAPPPGGLVLTVYDRPLGRSNDGQYRLPESKDLGGFRTHAPHGQRGSLWLTEEECRSLIPQDPQKGQSFKVPAKLARRICLYGMWPQTLWVVEQVWQPNSVREAELNLTVEEVTAQKVSLRIEGTVLLSGTGPLKLYPTGKVLKTVENRYDARMQGVLEYDRTGKRITRWNMAALGDYAGSWFAGNDGWKEATRETPVPLGFAFEIDSTAYQVPAERRRPRSFVHAYIFKEREPFYWDPEKWEKDWKKRQKK